MSSLDAQNCGGVDPMPKGVQDELLRIKDEISKTRKIDEEAWQWFISGFCAAYVFMESNED